MTALTAPPPTRRRPWRAGDGYLAAMSVLTLGWFAAAWRWHDGWDTGPAGTDASVLAPLLLTLPPLLLILVASAVNLRHARRRRPVAFDLRDGAFVAPPADRLSASNAATVLAGCTASTAMFLSTAAIPGLYVVVGRVTAATMLVLFLLRVVIHGRGSGRILLRPEGLRITYQFGSRDVPWEAVSAGPRRTASVVEPVMRIGRPELLRTTGPLRRRPVKVLLPAGEAWIRREFLIDAVNYYLAVPAARVSIGTADGYAHLRRVLRAD